MAAVAVVDAQEKIKRVKNFEVKAVDVVGISAIRSEGSTVIIVPVNSGVFEYSLDGINFQESNIFKDVTGGIYKAYQKSVLILY